MASLRTMVGIYRDELREGIAHVVFWKEGRSWNAEAFWLNPDTDTFEYEDADRVEEILEKDPKAIIVNGYTDMPFTSCDENGKASDIQFMMDHIRYRYEDGHNFSLAVFFEDYKSSLVDTEIFADADEIADENKSKIVKMMLPVLQETRNLSDLVDMVYKPGDDIVICKFAGGYTKIANVHMDSGTSMIRDIIGQIV